MPDKTDVEYEVQFLWSTKPLPWKPLDFKIRILVSYVVEVDARTTTTSAAVSKHTLAMPCLIVSKSVNMRMIHICIM